MHLDAGQAFVSARLKQEKSGMAELKKLVDTLGAVGKPTELFESADGTKVLVLPHGGRVLGLFAPNCEENFYWTNDALASPETAREFYAGEQWQNSGGDRTWLSPEIDLFFPNFPNRDVYYQQRSLDPGNYQIERSGSDFKLVNNLTVNLSRTKLDIDLKITKWFGPAANPLRFEKNADISGLQYAGYSQFTSLEVLDPATAGEVNVGLWNLVQMPQPGDLLVATYSKAEPKIYFGTIGKIEDEDMIVSDHMFRYRMRQQGEHKLAVRAAISAGRVGYLYDSGDDAALIIRCFRVNPSGAYVDVPWEDPDDFGYAIQACNVNSGLGKFNELEYHVPAIGRGTGAWRCNDEAQVWAFRGAREKVLAVARILLGSEV